MTRLRCTFSSDSNFPKSTNDNNKNSSNSNSNNNSNDNSNDNSHDNSSSSSSSSKILLFDREDDKKSSFCLNFPPPKNDESDNDKTINENGVQFINHPCHKSNATATSASTKIATTTATTTASIIGMTKPSHVFIDCAQLDSSSSTSTSTSTSSSTLPFLFGGLEMHSNARNVEVYATSADAEMDDSNAKEEYWQTCRSTSISMDDDCNNANDNNNKKEEWYRTIVLPPSSKPITVRRIHLKLLSLRPAKCKVAMVDVINLKGRIPEDDGGNDGNGNDSITTTTTTSPSENNSSKNINKNKTNNNNTNDTSVTTADLRTALSATISILRETTSKIMGGIESSTGRIITEIVSSRSQSQSQSQSQFKSSNQRFDGLEDAVKSLKDDVTTIMEILPQISSTNENKKEKDEKIEIRKEINVEQQQQQNEYKIIKQQERDRAWEQEQNWELEKEQERERERKRWEQRENMWKIEQDEWNRRRIIMKKKNDELDEEIIKDNSGHNVDHGRGNDEDENSHKDGDENDKDNNYDESGDNNGGCGQDNEKDFTINEGDIGKSEDANNNDNNCNNDSSEDDSNNNDLVEKAIVIKKTDLDILSMKPIVVVETEPDVSVSVPIGDLLSFEDP